MITNLKARLAQGETCVGGWLSVSSPQVAEAMGCCPFDWVALDLEHGLYSESDIHLCFLALERHGCAPFARLPSADPFLARRLLDAGAVGLIIPVVEDADAFSQFAEHCYYPPAGKRGLGVSRQMAWGDSFAAYMSDFSPILIPQVETQRGVEAALSLAALECVDGLFLGPYDLSASLGAPGDFESTMFQDAIKTVKTACETHGKAPGYHQVAPDHALLQQKIIEGYRFLAFATDMFAMRHVFENVRAALDTVQA